MRNKKRSREAFKAPSYWQSYSDMMAALLLIFILIIAITLAIYKQKQTDLEVTQQQLSSTQADLAMSEEELKNYIGNEYLLQYELYHYLYGRENQAATDAAVTGYQIDADTRRAEVTFSVSDGSVVTGIYWLDSGSWEFAS